MALPGVKRERLFVANAKRQNNEGAGESKGVDGRPLLWFDTGHGGQCTGESKRLVLLAVLQPIRSVGS